MAGWLIVGAAASCVLVTLACASARDPSSELIAAYNLIAELPVAEVSRESVGLDLLSAAGQADGWAEPETDGQGSFRWSLGHRSTLELRVWEARATLPEILSGTTNTSIWGSRPGPTR